MEATMNTPPTLPDLHAVNAAAERLRDDIAKSHRFVRPLARVDYADLSTVLDFIASMEGRIPRDAELVDLYWKTSGDDWAIPDSLMVEFGRAVISRLVSPWEAEGES